MINDPFLAAYKPGVQAIADLLRLSLANNARFLAQQLKITNEALAETAVAMKEIEAAKDFPALLEIQTRLSRAYLEKSAADWRGLWHMAGQDQMDAYRQMQERIAQLSEEFRDAAAHAPAEAAPALAALRSMVDAACQTYAKSAQAAEELTRTATAHTGDSQLAA